MKSYGRAPTFLIMTGYERAQPNVMTVVAIMAGLLPIMWSIATDSEVVQRIAVPMIGGIVSSTLLTLIVISRHLWPGSEAGTCLATPQCERFNSQTVIICDDTSTSGSST